MTLIDQSPRMLDECRTKIAALDATRAVSIVQADVFEYPFDQHAYDSAFVGFLISHVTDEQEQLLFERLRAMLAAGGGFLIFDSVWSPQRARFNAKVERQERRLNDGSHFEVYKRYLDRDDCARWVEQYGVSVSIEHDGTAFVAVAGRFLA